ncbi:MAG: hypothetical protein IPK33_14495 [Gemmatimonadetes bacterium]|nr:hypothetical protein [Gemmatimonadota bacterium]
MAAISLVTACARARIAHPRLLEDVAQEGDLFGAGVQRAEVDAPAGRKVPISSTPAIPDHQVSREVEHHQKRRRVTRNVRDIGAHLAKGLPHAVVVGDGLAGGLPLEGEVLGAVAVDAVVGQVAVAIDDLHRVLEPVLVARRIGARRQAPGRGRG